MEKADRMKTGVLVMISTVIMTLSSCSKVVGPHYATQPGPRDYTWQVDTINAGGNILRSIDGSSDSSVWFVPGHYYVVGQGIYEKTSLSQSVWQEDSVDTVDFFSRIRGNAWNDFFVAGGYGQLLHFNWKTWRSYQNVLGLQQGGIASIAVKGNLMIGVGYLGSKAVAFVGKRS